MRYLRKFTLPLIVVAVLFGAAACDDGKEDERSGQERESASQQGGYDYLASEQPAHTMQYSPTRATANGWIDTWNEADKLSFVYLVGADGSDLGYYIFRGLPVSYCVALTPNYTWADQPHDGTDDYGSIVNAPSVDGVYYSGGQCNTYYGFDATTDTYMEYTAGLGISVLVFEEPQPRQSVPLGDASVDDAAVRDALG